MAKYKLSFKKSVAKDLRKLPQQDVKRILKCIVHLEKIQELKVVSSFLGKSDIESGRVSIELFMRYKNQSL